MKRVVELFLELAPISAISKEEKPVADYIRKFLNRLNIEVLEDTAGKKIGGNSGNLIAKIPGILPHPKIAFTAHMDTVKPTKNLKTQIKNGRVTSDGKTILGADNRAGIALILAVIEKAVVEKLNKHPFEAVFTIGEETGLFGSTYLDLTLLNSEIIYTMDSSASPGSYVMTSPTSHEFEIDFNGRPSHAAVNPAAGINALAMANAFFSETAIGQVDDVTTINIGQLCGGEVNNVVPAHARLTGEVRSFDPDKIDFYIAQMQDKLKCIRQKYGGTYRFKSECVFEGFDLPADSDAVKMLDEALIANNLTPEKLKYHGASDANMLNARGLPAIDVGIGAKNPHAKDEFIEIKDLLIMSDVMSFLISR